MRPLFLFATLWLTGYLLSEPFLFIQACLTTGSTGELLFQALSGSSLSFIGIFAFLTGVTSYRIFCGWCSLSGTDGLTNSLLLSSRFAPLLASAVVFALTFSRVGGDNVGVVAGLYVYSFGRVVLGGMFVACLVRTLICKPARHRLASKVPYVIAALGSVLFFVSLATKQMYLGWGMLPAVTYAVLAMQGDYGSLLEHFGNNLMGGRVV